jgi:hypothetical protein
MKSAHAPTFSWLPRLAFVGLGMSMAIVAGAVFP